MLGQPQPNGLIGESAVFRNMLAAIARIATYDATVLISGETGSGKELAARAIHYQGRRSDKPFIPVNCGALPDHLIENELFGHCKGAYTDAREHQTGLIAQAEGGTLFLDEVDALSPKAQVSLLRFLEDGKYRLLGGNRLESADVRILAASNTDLQALVDAGGFRADLHYRLNVMELAVPPLRVRGDDIALLARHFIGEAAQRYGMKRLDLHPDTVQWLASQPWPGNIRELRNVLEQAAMRSDAHSIDAEMLRALLREAGVEPAAPVNQPAMATGSAAPDSLLRPLAVQVAELERRAIAASLAATGGNKLATARQLGISRATLYQRLENPDENLNI